MRLRVLLLEPWLGGSHRQWAEGYRAASDHEVTVLGLDPDRWRWRLRGGAVPLARAVGQWVTVHGRPDRVLVSSPLDAARLLGLLRHDLAGVPVAVYQHESQLLYPNSQGVGAADDGALHDWFSWLAADAIWFNSDWHRQSVIETLPAFLERMPDTDHEIDLPAVVDRMSTLPLGLDLTGLDRDRPPPHRGAPIILWPHRWEPDKDPAAFGRAIDRLVERGIDLSLVLAGEVPPGGSPERDRLVADHPARVLAVGPFDRRSYLDWLSRADVVVSCARHDFFGAGVAEAVAAGCVAVVPDALAYPEVLGPTGLYPPGHFGTRLAEVLTDLSQWRSLQSDASAALDRFGWSMLAPVYDRRLAELGRGP